MAMLNANTYVTEDKGIGGTIRNRWEDFYVEEIPEMLPDGEGPNIWIWIEKLGRSTLDVLLDISRDLHISRKRTGFAGMKDKNAITRQWICISNMESEEQFKEVEALAESIKNTEFLEITRGRKKLRMGQLKGNKFRILIKDVEGMENFDTPLEAYDDAAKRAEKILKKLEKTGVPNYFGWQRFGKPRTITHLVGEALIENDLKKYDLDMIYISGPGHGGQAMVANNYLEGIYSRFYPEITEDEAGLKKLFKQFSFPGGVSSHVAPETPGSIHEGGELGYSLAHAAGAVLDNKDLIVACIVGDGEAETGPLATSWHSNKFVNPVKDGAVLPILHLNGYKISNPTIFSRISEEELVNKYKEQLKIYEKALEQAYNKKVSKKIIYSTYLGREITI